MRHYKNITLLNRLMTQTNKLCGQILDISPSRLQSYNDDEKVVEPFRQARMKLVETRMHLSNIRHYASTQVWYAPCYGYQTAFSFTTDIDSAAYGASSLVRNASAILGDLIVLRWDERFDFDPFLSMLLIRMYDSVIDEQILVAEARKQMQMQYKTEFAREL